MRELDEDGLQIGEHRGDALVALLGGRLAVDASGRAELARALALFRDSVALLRIGIGDFEQDALGAVEMIADDEKENLLSRWLRRSACQVGRRRPRRHDLVTRSPEMSRKERDRQRRRGCCRRDPGRAPAALAAELPAQTVPG